MQLTIEDFQSLGRVDLTVEGLTVLVGPSNRGKSALVRAVEAVLFNKPGDAFIRTGKKRATVQIDGLPGVGVVHWEKNKTKAVYTLNGQTFGKLQGGTPPALEQAGYRDVWIGDKDRKKGEWLRPQVSQQTGGAWFLLDRSGAFVSDVLGAISRHAVLLAAQGRAVGDQRSAKQQLGFKQTELAAATQQLGALDDVPAFAARVEALRAACERRDQLAATVARLRTLVAKRAQYAPVAALERPPLVQDFGPYHRAGVDHQRVEWARGLVARRPLLLALGGSAAPAPVDVPTDLGAALAKARGLARYRPLLAALVQRPVAASALPALLAKLDASIRFRDEWQARLQQRYAALDAVYRCETAVRSMAVELEAAERELAEVLGGLMVCPTCDRPMDHRLKPMGLPLEKR